MKRTTVPTSNTTITQDSAQKTKNLWQPALNNFRSNAPLSQLEERNKNDDCPSTDCISDTDSFTTESDKTQECKQNSLQQELWRRELSGRLQIVHVDQYGKMVSELEPDPEKQNIPVSSFSKALMMLKPKSYDQKSQEEMAWKVAETIVDDICKITSENWA